MGGTRLEDHTLQCKWYVDAEKLYVKPICWRLPRGSAKLGQTVVRDPNRQLRASVLSAWTFLRDNMKVSHF